MDQKGERARKICFCLYPAVRCNAELLASVYDASEQERQVSRIRSLHTQKSANRHFFVMARYNDRSAALLHFCQEHKKPHRFRIRGLHTHKQFRNQGLATRLLQFGIKCVVEYRQGREIISYILPTNIPSIIAHERAGFVPFHPHLLPPERYRCFMFNAVFRQNRSESRAVPEIFG